MRSSTCHGTGAQPSTRLLPVLAFVGPYAISPIRSGSEVSSKPRLRLGSPHGLRSTVTRCSPPTPFVVTRTSGARRSQVRTALTGRGSHRRDSRAPLRSPCSAAAVVPSTASPARIAGWPAWRPSQGLRRERSDRLVAGSPGRTLQPGRGLPELIVFVSTILPGYLAHDRPPGQGVSDARGRHRCFHGSLRVARAGAFLIRCGRGILR